MSLIVPPFENTSVLIVGDVMLDRYWTGSSLRISPEAPVGVVHVRDEEYRPGGAANVALNVAALGGRSTVLGLTGGDGKAEKLESILADAGVRCVFERVADCQTITKLRVLSRGQQLIRMDFEQAFPVDAVGRMTTRAQGLLAEADVVLLSDYGKGAVSADTSVVQNLIRQARAAGKPVLVDPKGTDFERYRGATLITPNLPEFEAVVGKCADEAMLVERGMALLQDLELEALLVTRGKRGMSLLRREASPLHLPTRARDIFDVTGAGDTAIAALSACLAAGLDLPTAVEISNMAAGMVVGKLGASTITAAELQWALHDLHGGSFGVVDEGRLADCLSRARIREERIVMTNGVFDILHAGHVYFLEKARELGKRLIVAVNDDASVRRLDKGKGRPVNSLEHRMAVLAGLSAVDWVVPFTEDTPERLICRLRPDVLVKGSDYRPDEIAGGRCVLESGGEVKVVQSLEGLSTTRIVEHVRRHVGPNPMQASFIEGMGK